MSDRVGISSDQMSIYEHSSISTSTVGLRMRTLLQSRPRLPSTASIGKLSYKSDLFHYFRHVSLLSRFVTRVCYACFIFDRGAYTPIRRTS